jgi:hypothetical protein
VARTRTTKKLAQRIDLNYFKRPTPLKRAKFWLSLLLPLLALVWIGERTFFRDSRVYSSGRLSEPHAILEKQCDVCHVQNAGAFSAKASDNACLACHDGPNHHEVSLVGKKELACADCHTEHYGRVNLSAASNQSCATCHAELQAVYGPPKFASHIRSFEDGHPEFAALRAGSLHSLFVRSTIRLNHAIHVKLIRRGPAGPMVQLDCADCHRPAAVAPPSTYSDANYVGAKVSYTDNSGPLPDKATTLSPRHPASGREQMAPVKFANACAGCHLLNFDKRFDIGVPHDEPGVVRGFMLKKFQEYIAAHPEALRERRDPHRDLTGKLLSPEFQVLTPAQWVAEHTGVAEELLWRKTCVQCHTLTLRLEGSETLPSIPPWLRSSTDSRFQLKPLPEILVARTTLRWMPHAKFDHGAHTGFTCLSCHEKALTSTEASDVLVPRIATCQTCHAPGPDHAESRCFECHTYHDWSKRKEVKPTFTLPALHTGGQAR